MNHNSINYKNRLKKYKRVLNNLVNKVDVVINHPDFVTIFQISSMQGVSYTGPKLKKELEEAKKLLAQK